MVQSYIDEGVDHLISGHFHDAEEVLKKGLTICTQFCKKKSEPIASIVELMALCHLNLGALSTYSDQLELAEEHYNSSCDLYRTIYDQSPSDIDIARGLARACNNLAVLKEQQGEPDKAEALYLESIDLREKVHDWVPMNEAVIEESLNSCHNLSLFCDSQGESSRAAHYREKWRELPHQNS